MRRRDNVRPWRRIERRRKKVRLLPCVALPCFTLVGCVRVSYGVLRMVLGDRANERMNEFWCSEIGIGCGRDRSWMVQRGGSDRWRVRLSGARGGEDWY